MRAILVRSPFWLLPVAVIASSLPAACGSPGDGQGPGFATAGSGASGDAGAAKPIDNTQTTAAGYGWFERLKAADCSQPATALPESRIWRLDARQWSNTTQQALAITPIDPTRFPGDPIDPRTGFSNDSTDDKITLPLAQSYWDIGDEVATSAAPALLQATSCLGTAPIAAACAQSFVATTGQRLFRRPLTTDETNTYASFLTSQSSLDPPVMAVTSLLRVLLLSPNFVYRTELGNSTPGPVTLTGNEIASLLAYTITDAPPDAALSQAAAAGQLTDPAVREMQARRLLSSPAAKVKLADFWRQYLSLGAIPVGGPIDAALAASMIQETATFFDRVVWNSQAGSLNDLLTANYTYADPRVAAIYGTATPAADGRLTLTTTQRGGFLTQASILVGTATPSQASTVIHRGLLVRQRLLCEPPPPPPVGFVPNPVMIMQAGADATARENYNLFAMTMPSCNMCHTTFQPIGLAFETYDALGNYRTAYPSGKPVLAAGELTNAGDATGTYADVVELGAKIGKSQIGQYCFSQQFAEYVLGRGVNLDQEACTVRTIGDYVAGKGGAVRELFTSMAHVDTVYRRFHE